MTEKLYIEDFAGYNLNGSGQIKVTCPLCVNSRTNKRDRSLSINKADKTYKCHYCEASGKLFSKQDNNNYDYQNKQRYFKPSPKTYKRPNPVAKKSEYTQSFLEHFSDRGISEETLTKAKVRQCTEYFPQLKANAGCIAFDYYLNEELINTKFRTRDKDFKLISGAEIILYNMDSITTSQYKADEEKWAIWVEGEIDCLTYLEVGLNHCVSVPNGASTNLSYLDNYIEEYIEPLDVIYISVDNDKKGVELKSELLRRLGAEKCRIIDYPEPCKDANEVLVKYGKEKLLECFANYTEIKPKGVQELFDVENDLDYLFNNGYQAGDTIGVPSFDKLLSFKTGLLYTITGVPSSGKTFALNFILTKLNILHDWKTAFFSPEFYPTHDHIGQIMETLGGKRFSSKNYTSMEYEEMKDYVNKNFFWIDPDDTDISSVMERAKFFVKKRGIKSLVIDPFNALTDKERGTGRKDEYISDFLQMLRWFARKNGIAIFLVMHPTKMQRGEDGLYPVADLYNCKGGSEIFDKSDIGLTVWRDKENDYATFNTTKIKYRHLGKLGYATFKFNMNNGRYSPIEDKSFYEDKMINMRDVTPEWDNSNYITTKLQEGQVQSAISFTALPANSDFEIEFNDGGLDQDKNLCPF